MEVEETQERKEAMLDLVLLGLVFFPFLRQNTLEIILELKHLVIQKWWDQIPFFVLFLEMDYIYLNPHWLISFILLLIPNHERIFPHS